LKQSVPYKIAIADSQFLITKSLITLIRDSTEYVFSGLADNLCDLDLILKSETVDLLITDINLIESNGLKSLENIISLYPQMRILILTNLTNRNELNDYSKIGIKNLIYKTADQEEIFAAIDSALRNKKYYSDAVLDLLISVSPVNTEGNESFYLTPTEINVVKLISSGLTTKEIASRLNISFHTVMSHRKNIFRKLSVNSVSELMMYAIRAGLIDNIEYHI
jgi:DNA-binding NarL/FixJ family response regulator